MANRGDNQFDGDSCIDDSARKHLLTVSEVVYIDILSLNLDDKVWLTDLINLMDMLAGKLLDSQ